MLVSVLPQSLHNAFSGSYKSQEDWDSLCRQDHLSPQSPQGQTTERKVSTVYKIQLNHTWVVCKIAIVINGRDSISGQFNTCHTRLPDPSLT